MKDPLNLPPLFSENEVRGVVFDLDGTLIDSAADIMQGMRMTLEQAGLGIVPDDYQTRNMHGTSANILRAIVADMGWHVNPDYDGLSTLYVRNAALVNLQRTRLYEGARDVLQACHSAGLPMAICTNKVHSGALAALKKFNLQEYFMFISGADTWEESKPSPLPLLKTIDMMHLKHDQCIYIGDTSADAECAAAADVRFVLHAAGYCDEGVHNWPFMHCFTEWKSLLADAEEPA